MTVTINTLPSCPYCVKAKKLLDFKGIDYEEIHGKVDNWPTVPYIVINGEHIGGYVELLAYIRNL